MENNKVQFTTSQMLKWMEYVADLKEVSPEKIKMLNTCGKRRNILATIATHKMILIFADETYYGTGYEPSEMKHCKVSDLMDDGISGPTVIFIVNENTRESMIFGMKNDNFSMGTVKYVGHEIRSVIMNKLELDVSDVALMVNSESIAIESSMVAYEGVIIADERDAGSYRTMEDIISLLAINPNIKLMFYTLELDILSDIKYILEKHGINVTEVMQITVSKTDKNSIFVAQPSPWIITGEK